MSGMETFFEMGGHAAYIWPAYTVVALVLAGLWLASRRFVHNSSAELEDLNPRARRKRGTDNEA